jgi:hypothetical protein
LNEDSGNEAEARAGEESVDLVSLVECGWSLGMGTDPQGVWGEESRWLDMGDRGPLMGRFWGMWRKRTCWLSS